MVKRQYSEYSADDEDSSNSTTSSTTTTKNVNKNSTDLLTSVNNTNQQQPQRDAYLKAFQIFNDIFVNHRRRLKQWPPTKSLADGDIVDDIHENLNESHDWNNVDDVNKKLTKVKNKNADNVEIDQEDVVTVTTTTIDDTGDDAIGCDDPNSHVTSAKSPPPMTSSSTGSSSSTTTSPSVVTSSTPTAPPPSSTAAAMTSSHTASSAVTSSEMTSSTEMTSSAKEMTSSCNNVTSSNFHVILDQYMEKVAKNGRTFFEWKLIKDFFYFKLDRVLRDFSVKCTPDAKDSSTTKEEDTAPVNQKTESTVTIATEPNSANPQRHDDVIKRILYEFRQLYGAPFTVQRLAELIVEPRKHYRRAEKFFRAVEKNLLIVTTVRPDGEREVFPPGLDPKSRAEFRQRSSGDAFSAILSNAAATTMDRSGSGTEYFTAENFSARAEKRSASLPAQTTIKRARFSPPHSTTLLETTSTTNDDVIDANDDVINSDVIDSNCDVINSNNDATNSNNTTSMDDDVIGKASDDVRKNNEDDVIEREKDDDVIAQKNDDVIKRGGGGNDESSSQRDGHRSAATLTATDYVELVETTTYAL